LHRYVRIANTRAIAPKLFFDVGVSASEVIAFCASLVQRADEIRDDVPERKTQAAITVSHKTNRQTPP
jgi:hypothetical protein